MRKILWAAAALSSLVAATPAFAVGGLSFIIDGDTFSQPYSITNTSTAGEKVVSFGFDLSSTNFVFDTKTGGVPNSSVGVPFTPRNNTDTLTGLVKPVTVADGATFFQIDFTNFTVGKTFSWDIDVDSSKSNGNVTVYGNELIGAKAFVDFSNDLRANGVLQAVSGKPRASAFSVVTVTPTPAVPEPATWAMMILGFGVVGYALRRRAVALPQVA
ncbi:MAG: PEPxxWA-CTERM sorting domain-containing protein [Sphingomonas phyllosphaerae]|uniref:PEPxxWA-CTERM sorting domain-containing protein n=1 Tax=Sphingomonas phyllosphaerae TaxID=257003 RepID=UPI002FF81AB6